MGQTQATTFDFWTLLFSGFSFIGLFYSVKLLIERRSNGRSRILGIYLLLQSITILEYVFYWTKLIFSFPAFSEVSLLFPLLFGPLLLIYINRSFGNDKRFTTYYFHFLPFLVALSFKMPFYFAPTDLKLYHTHEIIFGRYFEYYPTAMLCHLSIYSFVLVFKVQHESGVGSMRVWAKWLIGFFITYVVLSFLYQVLLYFQALSSQSDYFISLATCATIFLVAWYEHGFDAVANGRNILESLSISPEHVSTDKMIIEVSKVLETSATESTGNDSEKYKHSGLPKSLAVKLTDDLERLMQNEKLYRQNDLRLEVLAEKLNSSKHFISQIINQNFKMNFFEYINLKRIEEAKQLLRTTPREELNIIEVAYMVGFNNKGTFNSVFKKITGVTPSEFRRQSKQLLIPNSN